MTIKTPKDAHQNFISQNRSHLKVNDVQTFEKIPLHQHHRIMMHDGVNIMKYFSCNNSSVLVCLFAGDWRIKLSHYTMSWPFHYTAQCVAAGHLLFRRACPYSFPSSTGFPSRPVFNPKPCLLSRSLVGILSGVGACLFLPLYLLWFTMPTLCIWASSYLDMIRCTGEYSTWL